MIGRVRTALLLVLLNVETVRLGATTYEGHRTVGTGTADITIVTDGATGVLTRENILDWTIALKNGAHSFTLRGPLSGENSGLNLVGPGMSATPTELRFTFGPVYTYALFQRGFPGSSESFYCLDTSGCGGLGESLLAEPSLFVGSVTSSPQTGTIVIARAEGAEDLSADFAWSPQSPRAGQTVQFTDTSSGSPSSWRWNFGDRERSEDDNPQHVFAVAGMYTVRLDITSDAGVDRTEKLIVVRSATMCPIAQPAPPTDQNAVAMEQAAVGRSGGDCAAAVFTLHPPQVNETLDAAVRALLTDVAGLGITRLSGYRNKPYQQHLYDIKLAHKKLYDLEARDGASAAACGALASWIAFEIDKHCLKQQVGEPYLSVSPPATSAHTACADSPSGDQCQQPSSRALDLAVADSNRAVVAMRLKNHGLALCGTDGAFHVQLRTDGDCKLTQTVRAAVSSSSSLASLATGESAAVVRLLVTDGQGRRVGYDPETETNVNEFPSGTATYTGGDTGMAEILISSQGDGSYHLTAVGVATGSYEIVLESVDSEHGDVVVQRAITGNARPGEPTQSASIVVEEDQPAIEVPPGRRRAVRH